MERGRREGGNASKHTEEEDNVVEVSCLVLRALHLLHSTFQGRCNCSYTAGIREGT